MSEEKNDFSKEAKEITEKVRELVKKGNVARILIKREGETLVNLPLNVGIVGGIIGASAAPMALIAAAVATAGFKCKVEIVKTDGEIIDVNSKSKDAFEKVKAGVGNVRKAAEEKAEEAEEAFEEAADEFKEKFNEAKEKAEEAEEPEEPEEPAAEKED